MGLPIQPKYDVAKNTVVESDDITISGAPSPVAVTLGPAGTTVTLASAYLKKNGTNVGSSTTVVDGDLLRVGGTSPNANGASAFAPVLIAGLSMSVFGIITAQDPAAKAYHANATDDPIVNFGYVPAAPLNRLQTYTVPGNVLTTTNITDIAGAGPINDGLPYLFAADYIGDKVQRIDVTTGLAVQTIAVTKPYGVTSTPLSGPTATIHPHAVVASPTLNSVFVYDGQTHTLIQTANTGATPYGVCGTATTVDGDYGFWVTCMGADRVEYWKYTSGAALVRQFYFDLTAGSRPFQVAVDASNNAWVTCLGTNKVAKCYFDGTTATEYVTVGTDPWYINIQGGTAYVANSGSANVSIITLSTKAVVNRTVLENPTHVASNGAFLYVGSINNGTFGKYVLTDATTLGTYTALTTARLFTGMAFDSDGTKIYTLHYYNDSPDQKTNQDNSPDNLAFASSTPLPSTVTTTTTVTISGIADGPATVTIPNIYSSALLKNGSASAQSASIVNTNTLALRFTSPAQSVDIYIPIMWEGGAYLYTALMAAGPNPRVGGYMKGG